MSLLSGVRVLDLTNVLAGPFATLHLALAGAEVIKIENPGGGDLARKLGCMPELNAQLMGTSFLAQNSNKRSITLNLKAPEGREILKTLARTADVLVENFRPGVMERLGLSYAVLSAINPRLVYCAISGFGQTGPDAFKPAYDQIIQGLSGVMAVNGDERLNPLRCGFPVCDTVGGLNAAFAIMGALFHRERTGEGQFIDVALLDSIMPLMGWVAANLLIGGQQPVPMGNDNFTAAPSGTFATADGYINIAANQQDQWQAVCEVLGRSRTDDRCAVREARHAEGQPQAVDAAARGAVADAADRALGRGPQRARRAVRRDPVAGRGARGGPGGAPRFARHGGRATARPLEGLRDDREVREDPWHARYATAAPRRPHARGARVGRLHCCAGRRVRRAGGGVRGDSSAVSRYRQAVGSRRQAVE